MSDRVFIVGCGGMLGDAVFKAFSQSYEVLAVDIDVNESWLQYGDIRDIDNMSSFFKEYSPNVVINLAAITDLEKCEIEQDNAWLTNALGSENLMLLSKKYNSIYVYISTAGIFSGEKEFFTDFDTPNPLCIYAKSKYCGELAALSYSKAYIFRAGWMMGGGPKKDKKFINKIYQQIKSGKKELFVVDDKLGTPTYTKSFANGILKVITTGYFGLYNQVCQGNCSRYDVASEFIHNLSLENEIALVKVGSDYFKKEYFAPRPRSEMLVNFKLKARGIDYMPHWKTALADYSQEYLLDLQRG